MTDTDYPWFDCYELSVEGPDPILHLFIVDEDTSIIRPKTGLTVYSEYTAFYLSPLEDKPLSFRLASEIGGMAGCGFWEINKETMPGIYGFTVPQFLRCRGYTFVNLHFDGSHPNYLELHGVDYDPYDSIALGLTTWIRSTCHEHLSSGLRKSMPATLKPLLQDLISKNSVE